jgi:hypothetical protein
MHRIPDHRRSRSEDSELKGKPLTFDRHGHYE